MLDDDCNFKHRQERADVCAFGLCSFSTLSIYYELNILPQNTCNTNMCLPVRGNLTSTRTANIKQLSQ